MLSYISYFVSSACEEIIKPWFQKNTNYVISTLKRDQM